MQNLASYYTPKNEQEARDWSAFLAVVQSDPEGAFLRGVQGHLTATALVLNCAGDQVLLLKHKIFGDYCAPGGHADGEKDPLFTAVREAQEETGAVCFPVTCRPVSFQAIPVSAHLRRGVPVLAHTHFCFTYLLYTNTKTLCFAPQEATDARFVPRAELAHWVTEPQLLDIYLHALTQFDEVRNSAQQAFLHLPQALLKWFSVNKRDLPWRKNRTPYRVWLSEIMLQQTRVEAVKEYYTRALAVAPTVEDLAALPEDKLMKLWEGLGYYTRMRNLKRTAEVVVQRFGGEFPHTREELQKLPGIGAYTAGAIASIAFQQRVAAVDGNVIRVVQRLTEDYQLADEAYRKALTARLENIYPEAQAGDFSESLMELGATVCLPNGAPHCEVCPLKEWCLAAKNGATALLPIKAEKPQRKTENYTVFLISQNGKMAVEKRGSAGVLSGMWQFPNKEGTLNLAQCTQYLQGRGLLIKTLREAGQAQHIFTHLVWKMKIILAEVVGEADGICFVSADALQKEVSLPSAFRKLLRFKA